jgi:hypothetical protein
VAANGESLSDQIENAIYRDSALANAFECPWYAMEAQFGACL